MNLEREAMRGRLAGLKDQRRQLEMRAEGLCRSIRQELNVLLSPVADLNVPLAAQQMSDLEAAWGELTAVDLQIGRLEKELD